MTHWVSICSLVFLSCSLSTQKKKLIPIKTDEKFHMQVTLTYVSSTSTVGLISKFPLTFLWGVCHSCYQLSPAFFAFLCLVSAVYHNTSHFPFSTLGPGKQLTGACPDELWRRVCSSDRIYEQLNLTLFLQYKVERCQATNTLGSWMQA